MGQDPDDDGRPTAVQFAADTALTDATFAPGAMIGEYRIEDPIGAGGMGVVYSAVHPMIGKRAAIKVLKPELCTERVSVQRFLDEAKLVNQIGHPNIVDIFAFGRAKDGRHYFVMEWLKGEPLRARMQRGPMTVAEACRITLTLSRALQAAHVKDVVHRDLKPDNVFLVHVAGEPPLVKLLDFGIAKLMRYESIDRTASGQIVGTPKYLSPEQAKGQPVDHRCDIYSLGAMLFEMLAGRGPFLATSAFAIVAQHLTEIPPRVSEVAPGIPPELDALVAGMLEKEPGRRPSLDDVCEVVETIKLADEVDRRQSMRELRAKSQPPAAIQTIRAQAVDPASLPPDAVPTVPGVIRPAPASSPGPRWVVRAVVASALVGGALVGFLAVTGSDDAPRAPAPATVSPAVEAPPAPAPVPATAPSPAEPPATETLPPAAESPTSATEPPPPPPATPSVKASHVTKPTHPHPAKTPKPGAKPNATDDDRALLAPGTLPR